MAKKSARPRATVDTDETVDTPRRRTASRKADEANASEAVPVKKRVRRVVSADDEKTEAAPRRKRIVKPNLKETAAPRKRAVRPAADSSDDAIKPTVKRVVRAKRVDPITAEGNAPLRTESQGSGTDRAPRGYILDSDDSADIRRRSAADNSQPSTESDSGSPDIARRGSGAPQRSSPARYEGRRQDFRRGTGHRDEPRRDEPRRDAPRRDDSRRDTPRRNDFDRDQSNHANGPRGRREDFGRRDDRSAAPGSRREPFGRQDQPRGANDRQVNRGRGRFDRQGRDGQTRDGQNRNNQNRYENQGRDNQGRDNQNRDSQSRGHGQRRDSSRDIGAGRDSGLGSRGPGRRPTTGRDSRMQRRGDNRPQSRANRGPTNGYSNRPQRPFQAQERTDFDAADVNALELTEGTGMLEMHPDGYGFLRSPKNNYARELSDPFVPKTTIDKYRLRPGLLIRGMIQPGQRQQGPRLRDILDIDGMAPDDYSAVKNFDQLTPINPENWYQLETGPEPITTRVLDMLTPLGKGQRALIVAPPRSGKTVMLQHISHGIAENYPDCKLIVLLIDERPEEVTDMRRNVKGEVVASSLDEDVESHVRLSQLMIERCKRLTEMGREVFLLLDSITRLARAFNKWVGNTGRTMSGGVDIKAMDIPKKLFATARAFEEGGSLTIVGTALIDTGSRMDELIFQEFKGTGNMELVLDRRLADRRVWPAIDINQSGTRREELLLPPENLRAVTMLRRTLTTMNPVDAMEQLVKQLGKFKSNREFIRLISGKSEQD